MQTYRLVVEPDGRVKVPDSHPGQIVIVTMDEPARVEDTGARTLATADTVREREAVKEEILSMEVRVRELLKDELPIDHAHDLYGEDGLPR